MQDDPNSNRQHLHNMLNETMEDDEGKIQPCQMLEQHFKGEILTQSLQHAQVQLPLSPNLSADKYQMTYTGFIECIAQYTALLLTNDKRSVVVRSESEFLTPIKTGLTVTFDAKESYHTKGYDDSFTQHIKVIAKCKDMTVYESTMMVLTLNMHPFYKPEFMNSIDEGDTHDDQ